MKASNHCIRLLDDFVEQIKNNQRLNISLILSSASGPFHYAMYISAGYSIARYLAHTISIATRSISIFFALIFIHRPSSRHSMYIRHRITRACLFAVKVIIFIGKKQQQQQLEIN